VLRKKNLSNQKPNHAAGENVQEEKEHNTRENGKIPWGRLISRTPPLVERGGRFCNLEGQCRNPCHEKKKRQRDWRSKNLVEGGTNC